MAAKRKADDVNQKGSTRNCTEPFRLPSIVIDDRHIRFLMMGKNRVFYLSDNLFQESHQPLFLGTDVLAGIKQDTKNHTRIHARYATQGLATKLVFTDVRIEGINNSGTVWFYSIQGMFQAVFEYHSLSVQRHCLQHLTDVWMKTSSNRLLEEMYNISPSNIMLSVSFESPWSSKSPPYSCSQFQSENKHHAEKPRKEQLDTSGLRVCDLVSQWTEEASKLREVALNSEENKESACPKEPKKIPLLRKLRVEKINEDGLEVKFNEGSIAHEIHKINFTTLVLDFLHTSLKILQVPEDTSFLSQLFQLLTSTLDNSLGADGALDGFGVGPVHLAVLTSLGKWLGEEFHHLEAAISDRVTSFKQRNINSIDNLPPAEQLVNEIFPPCMTNLVSTWIGLTELQSADSLQMDHNYGHKKSAGECPTGLNRNLYPVIQHILELANNSLVSGVAHVVYCQLRHAA